MRVTVPTLPHPVAGADCSAGTNDYEGCEHDAIDLPY